MTAIEVRREASQRDMSKTFEQKRLGIRESLIQCRVDDLLNETVRCLVTIPDRKHSRFAQYLMQIAQRHHT